MFPFMCQTPHFLPLKHPLPQPVVAVVFFFSSVLETENTCVFTNGFGFCLGDFPVGSVVKNLPAMQETQVQSLGQEDPPEKGAATHSSILAWRIPWTEEPGRLQSMGLQRVVHD